MAVKKKIIAEEIKKNYGLDESEQAFRTIINVSDEKQENVIAVKKKETRSKNVTILLTPTTYNLAKKKCKKLNISLNECINQLLEKWSNN